jgi:hypothetical protein
VGVGVGVPVLFLGLAGHATLAGLLIGGFFLGLGGTTFAIGVPFVNAWFPPERRGLKIVSVEIVGNITRPPNRSVSALIGIRPSEPTTTGTATSSAS